MDGDLHDRVASIMTLTFLTTTVRLKGPALFFERKPEGELRSSRCIKSMFGAQRLLGVSLFSITSSRFFTLPD